MAPKLFQKPLTATVRERLKAARLEELKAHRAAPPTAQHIASLHRLPWPKAPETEPAEMAKKKKRKQWTDEEKARIVARALKAKESSSDETIASVCEQEGVSTSLIYRWFEAARKSNGATATAGSATPKGKTKSNLKSVTRELSEAMEHVAKLKKQLRKMLGDD